MLAFFIIFCVVGFAMGCVSRKPSHTLVAVGIMVGISLLWAIPFGPWALATFVELLVGYIIAISTVGNILNSKKKDEDKNNRLR